MDKSAGNKKRSPAGTTRRAYSIFGGIINLAQQTQQQAHTPKSNVLSSPGNGGTAAAGGGGTSQDPQGSSTNVYTVTVTNSENPDNTNQVKTYENLVPVKKQKGDQSTSAVSSLTQNSSGMNSNSGGGGSSSKNVGGGGGSARGPIGPAPRTLSILTALNELAISDKIEANPTCSPRTPPALTGKNRSSGAPGAISKSNPTHSSCHYPSKRSSYGGNIPQQQHQHHHQHHHGNKAERMHETNPTTTNINVAPSTSSTSALHHHPHHHHQQYTSAKHTAASTSNASTSVYHSTSTCSVRGLYSTNSSVVGGGGGTNNVRLTKGYNEQLGAPPPPLPPYGNVTTGSKFPFSIAPSSCSGNSGAVPITNTLPLALRRTGNKSRGSHKESSARKGGGAKQRDRSKSRTPDWIWKIFQLTKHGKLEELQQSLLGLDPTLIRHLADAKGNTVLHCAARGGHVNTLQWLVSVLGSQCTEAALNDHNQAGRTVILSVLYKTKQNKGQLECLQWLVHQTKCGERALVPNEGERSLLHYAATNGDLNVVRWLCSELIDKGISVDIRDAGGMTPLHDAAKSGHITICHELILAGADPLSQTELGWRPSDLAIRHRHMECASYFMVAEAAGSLGNQLHSLLLAFNHLRQEHEELRSHFRETLRVGKWLAKERNDLIKHFPAKWTQESGTTGGSSNTITAISSPPSMLLGGTNNGARFSDLEHKLVVAEQAWKKMSQNLDKTGTSEEILNGEESSLSNVSSHDFLHRRLSAVQLRHERSQSVGNSMLSSGSSDEDPYEDVNSSSSEASNSDVDMERITSITAGSDGGGIMMVGQNSPAIIHSSTVSPSQKNNSGGGGTMRTRPAPTTSKAAPWLLPPNDAFLSQLSPFVGAHVGKSLPTLDLLHGAPTSPSLLSPIVTPSSPSTASSMHQPATGTATAAVAPAITTDTAGKNEKSLVQMDTERHGSNHAGKRDSTSLEISVLEVIEPTSHASPASSSFKKDFHQTPDLICGTQYRTRHSDKLGVTQQKHHSHQSLSLRGNRQRKDFYYSHSEENLVGHHPEDPDGLYEPISPYLRDDDHHSPQQHEGRKYVTSSHHHHQHPDNNGRRRLSNISFTKSSDTLDTLTTCKGESSSRKDSSKSSASSQRNRSKGGREQPLSRPSSSLSISLSARRKKSSGDNEHQQHSGLLAHALHERDCDNDICYSGGPSTSVNFASSPSAFGGSSSLHSVAGAAHSAGGSFVSSCDNANGSSSSRSTTRNIISKSRTPSPKSYVTKLTVIPVEATTETCFLSVRSTSFAQEEDTEQQREHQEQEQADAAVVEVHPDHHHDLQEEEESHQLHLPGDNPDELSSLAFSCQIPSYSVSSSNTPVMPRFNSSGTVVFPLRKPSSSDWHSTELLSLTTPDSSLAGRLSPTPSETSRTESALAPPPSYVSHASQNSEVSKTESARGHHHHHHPMNEVSTEERDIDSPVGGDGPLHLQSSFINHPAGNSSSSPFQSIHPHPPPIPAASSSAAAAAPDTESQQLNSSQNTNNNNNNGSLDNVPVMAEQRKSSSVKMMVDSFEMYKSDRKKNRDYSTVSNKKDQDEEETNTTHIAGVNNVADDDDHGDQVGDNDRSTVKPRGLFEKQQNRRIPACTTTTSTTRFIRSHLSTTNTQKTSTQQQQNQRLPKGHHHHRLHQRGHSKPWYEIEGSDDEGSLLQVVQSKSSHSSNFPNSINSNIHNNSQSSSGNSAASSSSSSTAATSNPEESSSQNESAAEESENNNSGGGAGGNGTISAGGDHGGSSEVEGNQQEEEKVGQSCSGCSQGTQQQNPSTAVTSNKKRNCSNFL